MTQKEQLKQAMRLAATAMSVARSLRRDAGWTGTRTMATSKELRWAQQDLLEGGRKVADAGMRLRGTKYEADYERLWKAIQRLNNKLIKEINGGK